MADFISWLSSAKTTAFTAVSAAALAVLLEFRKHTWATASLALLSGVFVAFLVTEPILVALSLPESFEHAVAGALGISGRGLIIWLLETSRDPLKAWKERK